MEPGSAALSWQASLNLSESGDLGTTLQQAAVLFNFSLHHAVMVLREHERRDAVFDSTTEGALIAAYAVVVATGVASNLLVAGVILSRSRVRTPRNVFLLNLNASDLVLCLVCVPFTLLELLRRHWPLGGALCRLLPFLQCASIFASSASVAIIAIDRQRCVLSTSAERRVQSGGQARNYSRKYGFCRWRKGRRVIRQTLIVWTTACLLSLPNCFSRHAQVAQLSGLTVYTRCVERWPHRYGKQAYTLLVLLAQFLIPVAVLTVAHLRIKAHLGLTSGGNVTTGSATSVQSNVERLRKELIRNRRATFILFSVSAVYAISWLPWNALNLAADLAPTLLSPRRLYLSFGVCHLVAMTSATTNPFLYGWLNTNIKKELLEVGERVLSSHRSTLTDTNNQNQRDITSEGNSNTRRIRSADPSYVTRDSDSNVSRRAAGERYQEGGAEIKDQRSEKADKETPLRKFYSLKICKRDMNLKKFRSFSMESRGIREQRNILRKATDSPARSRSILSGGSPSKSRESIAKSKSELSISNSELSISNSRESISNSRESFSKSALSISKLALSISNSRESIARSALSNSRELLARSALSISNARESLLNSEESKLSLKSITKSRESITISPINDSTLILTSDYKESRTEALSTPLNDGEPLGLESRHRYDIVSPLRNLNPGLNAELWPSNDAAFKTLSLENLEINEFPKSRRHLVIHCPKDSSSPPLSLTSSSGGMAPPSKRDTLNRIEKAPGAFLTLMEQTPSLETKRTRNAGDEDNGQTFHLLRVFSVRQPERPKSKKSDYGLSVEAAF